MIYTLYPIKTTLEAIVGTAAGIPSRPERMPYLEGQINELAGELLESSNPLERRQGERRIQNYFSELIDDALENATNLCPYSEILLHSFRWMISYDRIKIRKIPEGYVISSPADLLPFPMWAACLPTSHRNLSIKAFDAYCGYNYRDVQYNLFESLYEALETEFNWEETGDAEEYFEVLVNRIHDIMESEDDEVRFLEPHELPSPVPLEWIAGAPPIPVVPEPMTWDNLFKTQQH